MDEHRISLEELYRRIYSSENGLLLSEAKKRMLQYGQNIIEEKDKVPGIVKFLKQFINFFAILLMIGAALSFFAEYLSPGEGNLYIGIALFGVVVLNSIFTFIQEYQSEKIMESFKNMMPVKIQVLRNGQKTEILASEVVPGDIIFLSEGDKIPADARLIEHHALKVDNSSLTGESEPQLRSLECTHDNILESRNMVFSGTLVQSGTGKALVYATGMKTQIGKIARLTKETRDQMTPMRKEINYFIKIISAIAIALGIMFCIVSVVIGNQFIASIIFAIGIIVANVPEGLLPTVTLALSMASKKMAKKNALIKNLESVETLGSTTVICTDKTGTITQNKMFVNSIFLNLSEMNHSQNFSKIDGFSKLVGIAVLCNNSKLTNDKKRYIGDPTEGSLLMFADAYCDIDRMNAEHERINENPFDSKTKFMVTDNKFGKEKTSYLKGAPEIVIEKCRHFLLNNKIQKLDVNSKSIIENHYKKMSSRGERVLALAYKDFSAKEDEYIFVALAGIIDPPRPEIPGAIAKCKAAGIKVIMITGDYSLTAEAIAKQAGIVDENKKCIVTTGEELERMHDDDLRDLLKRDNLIFARTSPIQKLRIVQMLQQNGETVAVTGDGVNDAPALKNADIGVSMGVIGTEVSKEASDMVLLDDNFVTIVNAVEEGRRVYSNIKKFVIYILTSNVPEIMPFIAFVMLGIPLPLSVVLILSIDLGTDLIPALGLGNEKPESDIMKEPPRSRKERLLTYQSFLLSYGIIGMIEAAAGFFAYFTVLYAGGWSWGIQLASKDPLYLRAVSAFFASIVVCQIFNVMSSRTKRQSVFRQGLLSNKIVLMGIGVEIILLSIIIFTPFGNAFFGTAPLTLGEILLSLPFAVVIVLFGEFRKFLIRKDNRFIKKYLEP